MAHLLFALLYTAFVIGSSIVGMIWGWGIEPQNWGWIAFSYMVVILSTAIQACFKS